MNRAVAKRAMFEQEFDLRRFQSRLEIAVDRCGLEVHAFAVMQNHFHLLVRSREGRLSQALHLIQAPFASLYNRCRDRDGPLHRGRFRSELVESEFYQRYLVRYIDANPVLAGLVERSARYVGGSARHYARREGPDWLARYWVESEVCRVARSSDYRPEDYERAFPSTVTAEQAAFMDRMPCGVAALARHGDQLLSFTVSEWAAWMAEQARKADGVARFSPVVPIERVRWWRDLAGLSDAPLGRRRDTRHSLQNYAMVLWSSQVAGRSIAEIARDLGCGRSTAGELLASAARRQREDSAFAARIAEGAKAMVRATWAVGGGIGLEVGEVADPREDVRSVPGTRCTTTA